MKQIITIILLVITLNSCGTLSFQRYDTLGGWIMGKPGYRGVYFGEEPADNTRFKYTERFSGPFGGFGYIFALFHVYYYHTIRALGTFDDPEDKDNMSCDYIINEKTSLMYLGFRTPELILNPQGGFYYPEMLERKFSKEQMNCKNVGYLLDREQPITNSQPNKSEDDFENHKNLFFTAFFIADAGIIDTAIPFRAWTSNEETKDKCLFTVFNTFIILPTNIVVKAFQLPFYVFHDVFRLVLIPVAGVYYGFKEESD